MTWFRSPEVRRIAALIAFAGLLIQAGFAAWHIVRMGPANTAAAGAPQAMLACTAHGPATAWDGAAGGGKSAPKPTCPCCLGLSTHLASAPLPVLPALTSAPRAAWPVPTAAAATLSGRSLLAPDGRGPPFSA